MTCTLAQILASAVLRQVGLDVMGAFAIMSVLQGHVSAPYLYYPHVLRWFPYWWGMFFVLSGWLRRMYSFLYKVIFLKKTDSAT